MLHTEETVRAGIRVKDGSRVYYLPEGDRLTPSARDWLRNENVRILRPQDAPPKVYTTLSGGTLTGKPEHMTHLYGNVLVPKDHPRIAFRGMIDALEAEILLCQSTAAQEKHTELLRALQEILDFVRSLIRADVLGEPVVRIMDPTVFMQARTTGRDIRDHRAYLPEYQKYVEQTVVYDREYHLLICILRDVTDEETQREKKESISRQTVEIADKVVDKQMRIVQEIASLLGETAAETKIALTKLKESISDE